MAIVHTLPLGDLIEHENVGDDCPCGPTIEPVPRDDGSFGWLISHHSLDGREAREEGVADDGHHHRLGRHHHRPAVRR
jgi:hypothetical protein